MAHEVWLLRYGPRMYAVCCKESRWLGKEAFSTIQAACFPEYFALQSGACLLALGPASGWQQLCMGVATLLALANQFVLGPKTTQLMVTGLEECFGRAVRGEALREVGPGSAPTEWRRREEELRHGPRHLHVAGPLEFAGRLRISLPARHDMSEKMLPLPSRGLSERAGRSQRPGHRAPLNRGMLEGSTKRAASRSLSSTATSFRCLRAPGRPLGSKV